MAVLKSFDIGGQPVFLYFLVVICALGGFLFGYDTGVVSGAMLKVRKELLEPELSEEDADIWHSILVSATIVAAAICSPISGEICNRSGRKMSMMFGSLLFTLGAVFMAVSDSKETLLIGRIVVGGGLGFSSSTVPLYIAEVSPEFMRGFLTTFNQIMITIGMFMSNISAGIFSEMERGYKIDFGIGGVPSFLLLIGLFVCPESPRWLVEHGRISEAKKVLGKIRRNVIDVEQELDGIIAECEEEAKHKEAIKGEWVLGRMMRSQSVRRAFLIGCLLHMFQQLAGINTVLYYSATILEAAGLSNSPSTIIWITAGISFANVISTIPGMYLIERLGRRSLVLWSMGGIILSCIVLVIGFHLTRTYSPTIQPYTSTTQSTPTTPTTPTTASSSFIFYSHHYEYAAETEEHSECGKYTDCIQCVESKACGYCASDENKYDGICFKLEEGDTSSNSSLCSEDKWFDNVCPSEYAFITIIGMCLYLICFASGLGPTAWTINSEIYPLWCRSTAISLATLTNWCANIIVSTTYLKLEEELKQWTFFVYAGTTGCGLVIFYFFLPETKGRSLEEMEQLFSKPLYKIGTALKADSTVSLVSNLKLREELKEQEVIY